MKDTVCIVGAGPSGLVAAKKFRDAGLNVCIFEATDSIGGVWVLRDKSSKFKNAMYENLTTNLPAPIMAFEEHPFPLRTPMFPPCQAVLEYLVSYADRFSLAQHIHFCTTVTDAAWDDVLRCWRISTCDATGHTAEHSFAKLAVCNGHYNAPDSPKLPGINDFPGDVCHSYAFHTAHDYSGKSVLIVGGSASAADIAAMLLRKATDCTVHLSMRSASKRMTGIGKVLLKDALKLGVVIHGGLERFTASGTAILASHPDGVREEVAVDSVILATGYKYEVPFLRSNGLEAAVCGDGVTMHHLFKRIFYTRNTSLAFLGTSNVLIPPFAVFERQAQLIAKVWARALDLPDQEVMKHDTRLREERQLAQGNARDNLAGETFPYCNELASLSGTEGYWSVFFRSKLWRLGASALLGRPASSL
eukprot:TRINITY_DN60941_c0_g1_i1.p1 TRINITY_DN60941_c0_g1~~TRINITY_DN60941_c0_g1_i1.p1  ORF type:complete len:418 (+),score=33.68 TRINITY_DN60941_c0_g1_i1:95-1348(+)